MCKSLFSNIAKLNQKMPHSQLKQTISRDDPLSKALGYEGLADPLGEWESRRAGTTTKLARKQERLRDQRAVAARTKEATPTGGHIRSIAAYKASSGRG
jgi:hypothetical protein